MKAMQSGKPLTPAPKLETNQVSPGPETTLTDNQEKVKLIQEKANKGKQITEKDEYDALDAILPKGFME